MPYKCYLKKHTVYVPTVAKLSTGAYDEVEPVAVIPITDTAGLRHALLAAMARGNTIVPNPQDDNWPPPVLLKYAGAKSWSAFMRGTATWTIKDFGGVYQIVANRVHARGDATEDPEQKVLLPPGSTANDAVDRMIAILQSAASK